MYYIIYKIINKLNNKYYIGKHQTSDINDGYMGSGKLIRRAIKKYGSENFVKEILFVFDNEKEMNDKEAELVVVSEETYNLCPGGHGGFGYINKHGLNDFKANLSTGRQTQKILLNTDPEYRRRRVELSSKTGKKLFQEGKFVACDWSGKKHKEISIKKMKYSMLISDHQKGDRNSQYGSFWITNGSENKKIKHDDTIPSGFIKGRTLSPK